MKGIETVSFLNLAYCAVCVHLLCIQWLSPSLLPLSSCSHTLRAESEGKRQLNFLSLANVESKKVQSHSASVYLLQTLNAALIHSSALPLSHMLVSKNPLHSIPGINYFISFRSIAFLFASAVVPQLLSLWRALMNVLGSEPLIISALKAFRYTLASGCLQCT